MGYEIRLIVGRSGHPNNELELETQAVLDDNLAYFPLKKDAKDRVIETGRVEVYFQWYGIIDLACPGTHAHVLKLDWKNKEDNKIVWYFYEDGTTRVKKDGYGDTPKPVPVADVIAALEKDLAQSTEEGYPEGYRRFRWAIAFLKSMDDDAQVLLHGH